MTRDNCLFQCECLSLAISSLPLNLKWGTGRRSGYTINGGSCHKYHFCRGKTRVCRAKTRLLSLQKYACRYKTFVVTKLCFSPQNSFVTTKDVFWLDKHTFVATKDYYFFVATNICLKKKIATKICLTRQAYFCRDKRRVFVATKLLSQLPPIICSNRPSMWFKGSTQTRRVFPPEEPPTWQPH